MPIGRTVAPRGILLLSAAFAALTVATPAAAQENVFILLDRLIFGTGTAKIAIDTPQAVTTLEQKDMDQRQPDTLADLFKGVPGVGIAGASSRALGQAFNIRGIGTTEQTASEERIKVTVDGAPKYFEGYRMGAFFGDLDLYKRVEVLRGPASATLYGSGTIGGVIAFTTKDAGDFLSEGKTSALRFKASYGSNGDPLGLGVIYAHRAGNAEFLAALNTSDGGEIEDGAGAAILGTEHESVSGLLKGKFTFGQDNDQSVTLSFSRTDVDLKDTQVVQTGGASNFPVFGKADIATVDDTATLSWNNSFADSDLFDLTVQLSYTDTAVSKRNFHDSAPGVSCAPGNFLILCDSDYGYATTTLKVENTSDLSTGGWDNFITIGTQASHQDRTASSSLGSFAFHPEGTDKRAGIYAQGEFTWNDKLVLMTGARVDFGNRAPSAAVIEAGGEAGHNDAASLNLAALYKFNETFAVFGSAAKTERMPNLDELYTSSGTRIPSLNLKNEDATTFELGFTVQKDGLLAEDDSFKLKATLFHNDLTNLIATNSGAPSGSPNFVNISKAKIWGGEIEASYDADSWFGQLAYSNVKSTGPVRAGTAVRTLYENPAENVVLTLGAKLPNQNLVIGWRGSYFDAITTVSASTQTPSPVTTAAYDTHDLFVTWSPDQGALAGIQVNFGVDNLFNKAAKNSLSQDNIPGRNVKISVAKTFEW